VKAFLASGRLIVMIRMELLRSVRIREDVSLIRFSSVSDLRCGSRNIACVGFRFFVPQQDRV